MGNTKNGWKQDTIEQEDTKKLALTTKSSPKQAEQTGRVDMEESYAHWLMRMLYLITMQPKSKAQPNDVQYSDCPFETDGMHEHGVNVTLLRGAGRYVKNKVPFASCALGTVSPYHADVICQLFFVYYRHVCDVFVCVCVSIVDARSLDSSGG